MDFNRPADDLVAKAMRPLVQCMRRVWILQKANEGNGDRNLCRFNPSLASFPSVKLLLGVAKGFLSSVKLLSAGVDRAGKQDF
jgi:hypothetical protein